MRQLTERTKNTRQRTNLKLKKNNQENIIEIKIPIIQ